MSRGLFTGRITTRRICQSCRMRYAFGEPKPTDSWPARLRMNSDQIDLLLVAAAEYKQLCDEAGEYADPVDFLDWVRPDALSPGFASPIDVQAIERGAA